MFRRSRFSIRPNVGAAGRAAAAAASSQDASETPKDVGEGGTVTAVTDNKSAVSQAEKPAASGDGNDQNGEGTNSSAAVQRRKRFSIKPKVAPGRPTTGPRAPKSPAKAVSATPVVPGPDLDQGIVSRPCQTEIQCLVPKVQPDLIPSESSGPSAAPLPEDSPEQTDPPADSCKKLEAAPESPVKEVPPKLPDKVPFSIPSREAIELSEKAKTLVASKDRFSLSPSALSLSRLLNDPSDLQRLAKARKLRELLRQESFKEKQKTKKARVIPKEFTLDPSKMTMRDLIHYLPGSNPMKSSLEDPALENEMVVPPSPGREESPENVEESADPPAVTDPTEEEDPEAGEEDDALMVPRVKVAEDGTLIIDEESLTVEVQRTKGPNPAQERDPIFERGSTTTYSSFRKGTFAKPWSSEETDMFFLAISMVGTDFSMICQLFPHRPRSEIKNKFKKEERANSWRIDKAFRERRKLDIEYFSKLLEKILEVQKNRKKLKSIAEKNSPKKNKRKGKGKKAAKKQSGEEEADEEEGIDPPDLEKEGEKENEDLCNEGGTTDSKPKKKRKRKEKAPKEEPTDKKNKTGEKSNEQDEACVPEDAEAALPEDCVKTDKSENSENAAKESAIKPAKLSRGRTPKPLLPLGRKWGKKPPPASTKAKDTAPENEDEGARDEATDEQVNKDASPGKQSIKRKPPNDDVSSEEEDVTIQPQRPTRYGRVPKPIKPLNYRAKEATSESTPTSPAGPTAPAAKPKPKSRAKRGQSSKSESASKKTKLVTLRASQLDYSDEESENQWEDGEQEEEEEQPACSSSKDSVAPAFVPASLRSPQPVISEVEESMEELDMLANIPDVLGISQDALCPDASCEMAQNETGTAETCEHQLDLLVDVIDFLSSEVCQDESYNEAAQTLLTIGNLTHLSQSAQNQTVLQDHITGMETVGGDETDQHLEVAVASNPAEQEENSATPPPSTFAEGVADTSEPVAPVELQNNTTDPPVHDQRTGSDMDSVEVPQMQSSPEKSKQNASQTRTGRLSKVKPKPNLSRASRTAQSRSTEASDPPQTTEAATGETSKTANFSQMLLKDEISCVEIKLKEEPSVSQEKPDSQEVTDAVELQTSTRDNSDFPPSETSDLQTGSDIDLTPQLESTPDRSKRNPPQTRTGRLSRVKPKPNLGQASRTAQSRSRSETSSTEESHRAAPDFSQPTETAAEEMHDGSQKGEISCIELTEEASGSHEMSIDQIKSGAAATDETLVSRVGTTESDCSNQETSKLGETNIDLGPVPQSVDRPAPCLTAVEDLHAGPKEGNEDESTCQARRSRFQRVKPKPNLAATSRTKPKTTKKDSDPTPNPKVNERTIDLEAEPVSINSPAKSAQSTGLSSVSMPSLDQGSTLSTTGELPEEKEHFGQVESSGATSDQSTSEMQSFPEVKFDPKPTPESAEEELVSHVSESLPVSQKEERKDASAHSTRRSRFPQVKPSLPQTSQTVRSRPEPTKDPVTPTEPVEKPSSPTPGPESAEDTIDVDAQPTCSTTPVGKPSQDKNSSAALVSVPSSELNLTQKPTEELSSADDQKTDGRGVLDSGSEGCEQNVSQRRRRLPKVKPNFGGSVRTTRVKAENPAVVAAVSQSDCIQDVIIKPTGTNTQRTDDQTATSVQSSESDSGPSQIKSLLPTNPESQHVTQPCPKTTGSNQSTDENESKSAQPSRKAPAARRGRLIKPKPNLRHSSQPPQLQQDQNTKQADADSGAPSESVDASGSHKPVSEPRPDFQETTEGVIERHGNQASPPDDAECSIGSLTQVIEDLNQLDPASNVMGSALGCLTQGPDNSAKPQGASTSTTGEIQDHSSLSIFADMLPEQVASDLDEPFFILSLTEIPVCSSGEVLDGASASLPHLTLTEPSVQQPSSIPGLAEAGDVVLSNVPVPMEESFVAGLVGPEAAAQIGAIMEGPVDPHESTSKLPETEEINDEAECSPAKPRLRGTKRPAAKLQDEPTTQRKTRASKTPAAKESTPPSEDSEPPGPSVQLQVFDELAKPLRGRADTQIEAQTGGKDPEDPPSTRGAGRQNRKAKGFPSLASETNNSDSPRGKAASSSRAVKTRAGGAGKRSAPAPKASTSKGIVAAPGRKAAPRQTHSTPSTTPPVEVDVKEMSEFQLCSTPNTSLCTAEVSASQQSGGLDCEEPTNVSQYFLSDIFTDVEEG